MSKTVQFQIIQFSISSQFKCKYTLVVKNNSVLIQLIQFSISTDFVYTQLHVKTVPCQTQFQCQKTVLFEIIQF